MAAEKTVRREGEQASVETETEPTESEPSTETSSEPETSETETESTEGETESSENEATEQEILNLPELKIGEKSSDFLHIIHAATKMAFHFKTIKVTAVLERNWEVSKRIMSQNLQPASPFRQVQIAGNLTIVKREARLVGLFF